MFWSRMQKIPKGRGKRVISGSFLDPGSPKPASDSPGSPNCLGLKEPACLGKPITSGWSISSPEGAAMVPNAIFFYRREGGLRKGSSIEYWRNWEKLERRRRKKRKMRSKCCRITTVISPYAVSHSVFFVRHSVSGCS